MPLEPETGIILDTHIWVWLNTGSRELSKEVISRIDAASLTGQVCIPAIVVWEIATLVAKGRLTLNMPTEEWIREALSKRGVELIGLLPEIAVESARLPGSFHGDPADRLIVSTARIKRLPLLTRDSKILSYSRHGYLTVIKA